MWFRVDDKMHDHRKARQAGVAAMGLWCLAGSWCGDNLTDGFVPESVAARWDRNYRKLAAKLVEVGFWVPDEVDGEAGWRFHDWHDLQPTREKVLEERAAARERMANARKRSRDVRANTDGTSDDVRLPRPDPTRPTTSPSPVEHTGQHASCRACGTNPRAKGTNPRGRKPDPEARPEIPDAAEVIALHQTEEAVPMPETLRKAVRRA